MNNNAYQISTGTSLTVDTLELPKLDLSWLEQESFDFGTLNTQSTGPGSTAGGITTINSSSVGTITGIVTNGTTTGINQLGSGYGLYDSGLVSREDIERIVDRKLDPVYRRLAILEEPDQRVLDRYQSLREAYDHYRTLEGLMYDEIQRIKSEK